ncbi:lipase family protein [Corynebacterium sp. TAE3-ERU12]|uniref:lipase family protein n=1 Tax=Corynebacterium sp. TAE3-ERU12 TaxID=2849491 RepID=UPI001C487F32|nr:lipase family protein [Corynebacterium sp. TAE3-ERU12]MBV7294350.1 lipase family protein [Corynebacterium sp. TAE3-ERU12]
MTKTTVTARRAAAIAFSTLLLATTPAHAAPSFGSSSGTNDVVNDNNDPFYDTSAVTAGAPGDILRTQQAPTGPMPAGLDYPLPSSVTKILYSTTDMYGQATPVSGYVIEPSQPWVGPGNRPTVVIGRGTVGQGDQCAPSRNWPLDNQPDPISSKRAVAFEGLYDWIFAGSGVRVVVTDYIGMGTSGIHTYMNRDDQAHAMIDAARAARNLVGNDNFGQVAFYGHSQGGGASAAAVEAAPSYGPDLDVAAAYASAPPADLSSVQRRIDGSDLMGAIGFTINGMLRRYPELDTVLQDYISDKGRAALDDISTMCTNDVVREYGFTSTSDWTQDGRTLDEILTELPEAQQAMDDQLIGLDTPTAPVMIVSGKHDTNVEYQQAKDLANHWCEAGANIVYRDDFMPPVNTKDVKNHFIQAITGAPFGVSFILSQFEGGPVVGGCNGGLPDFGSSEIAGGIADLPGIDEDPTVDPDAEGEDDAAGSDSIFRADAMFDPWSELG